MTAHWRPHATLAVLRQRAAVLAQMRHFFACRGVMEVDTPVWSMATATDPHIASFSTCYRVPGGRRQRLYAHTSPEFPMKRLLAAGIGPIYQICKVFRNGEEGRWHNPEFTLLEWYRPGFDHHALMDEMDELLALLLGCPPALRTRYRDIFYQTIGIDPLQATIGELHASAVTLANGVVPPLAQLDHDGWLDLLLTHHIAATLGQNGRPTFVYDYPATQAALAKVRVGPPAVAERFEVYFAGMELANGFHELTDAQEQRRRCVAEQMQRRQLGLPVIPLDEHLLAALEYGLPACAGVALGVERLLMAITQANSIAAVMAFPIHCA